MEKILVTGAAGFIGFHLSKRLCDNGYTVVGIDDLNDYYDVNLKKARLELLSEYDTFSFEKIGLSETDEMQSLFKMHQFTYVVHLAAQAGVRYSIANPKIYIKSNIDGFLNVLEGCRHSEVKHLVYASSSSVYGANTTMPFAVENNVDHPISLYAATKKSNELMAHTYSHLYSVPTTGLRFFTVYGPWGRPDMALFQFTKAIIEGKPIDVYNEGKMLRDFTYVDDIVEGIIRLIPAAPDKNPDWDSNNPNPADSFAPYKIYNIGNNNPVELMSFIHAIEKALNRKAKMNLMPLQPGDVPATYANVDALVKSIGFKPDTSIDSGIQKFVDWYLEYYKIDKN